MNVPALKIRRSEVLTAILAGLACFLVIDQLRLFGSPLLSVVIRLETQYYFALIALLLPGVFLIYRSRWPALDAVLGLGAFLAPLWLLRHAEPIANEGWEFLAPDHAIVASSVVWLLATMA